MIESDRSTPAINIDEVLSSLKGSHTLGYESVYKPQQITVIKAFVSAASVLRYLLGTESLFAILPLVFDCSRVTWSLATMLPRTGTSTFL